LRLPRRYAPFVYGVIQAALTTAVVTAIALRQMTGTSFLQSWIYAWALAFVSILPVVTIVAPLIHRAAFALTKAPDSEH